MPRTKISEFSATPASNTDIDSINISEGCAPSGINDAIRELMAQLKDFQTGAVGDSFNGPVGTTTAAAGAFTTLSASSTLSVTGAGSIQGLTVGRGAGALDNNTAVGAGALASANSGTGRNTAVGAAALTSNTTGANNSGFGRQALTLNTTGSDNTASGYASLFLNTTGGSNTAMGVGSLQNNTTASNNTAVGYQAGYSTTTGTNNTAIGYRAGAAITTGNYNVAVGRLSMDNSAGVTSEENTALGNGTLRNVTSGANNLAVGSGALANNTTASGNVGVGFQAGFSNTTGTGNVSLGTSAGYSMTINSYSTYIGHSTGYNATGGGNTFVGNAGSNGSVGCGYYMTTGTNNTIIGGYTGNMDGLDIRASNNYVVISTGLGNRQLTMGESLTVALDSAVPQSGTGITFPAAQSASSDANTLDDYEEGTFTPTVSGATIGGATTYVTQQGSYTKIGRQVTISVRLSWSAMTGVGELTFGGFPFTSSNDSMEYMGAFMSSELNWDSGTYLQFYKNPNTTTGVAFCVTDNVAWAVQQCVNETAAVRFTVTYFV